jgi:cytochrome c nitrite reductase small subunit
LLAALGATRRAEVYVKQISIVLVAVLVGVTVGLGFYTFVYARGYSYLTNNPQACANCHVMQEYYDAWIKSPHRAVAACNDCHTPHNFAGKYETKVENGFFHSLAFTSGRFPDNIFIRPRDERVTESTCRSCHAQITTAIAGPIIRTPFPASAATSTWDTRQPVTS